MKKTQILVLIFLIGLVSYSQKKDIELTTIQTKKGFEINAINNTNFQQEITLTLTLKNLKGYSEPIVKLIPANSTVEMAKLFFINNKATEVRTSYMAVAKLTEEEKILIHKKIKEKETTDLIDLNSGIVVFAKDGCSRCEFTTRYLVDNNIDFRFIDTSDKNKPQNKKMWNLVKLDNPYIKSVKMPVILVDGKISYSINDLKAFVTKLKE